MPRRKDSADWIPLPARDKPTTSKRSLSSSAAEEHSPRKSLGNHPKKPDDVDDAIADLQNVTLNTVSDDDEDGGEGNDAGKVRDRLKESNRKLKKLLDVGKLVGEKGRPSQILQDALLSRDINRMAIPAIQKMHISRSVWNCDAPKLFTKKLLTALALRCCDGDEFEDGQVDATHLTMDYPKFCSTFVEEFAGDFLSGMVPDIAPVFASLTPEAGIVIETLKNKKQRITQRKTTQMPASVAGTASSGPHDASRVATLPPGLTGPRLIPTLPDDSNDPTNPGSDAMWDRIDAEYRRAGKLPVQLLPILIDTDSFQKSVANFFLFSHLLQDRKVSMTIDAKIGIPLTRPLRARVNREDTPDMFENNEKPADEEDTEVETRDPVRTVMLQLRESEWRELSRMFRLNRKKIFQSPGSQEV